MRTISCVFYFLCWWYYPVSTPATEVEEVELEPVTENGGKSEENGHGNGNGVAGKDDMSSLDLNEQFALL